MSRIKYLVSFAEPLISRQLARVMIKVELRIAPVQNGFPRSDAKIRKSRKINLIMEYFITKKSVRKTDQFFISLHFPM